MRDFDFVVRFTQSKNNTFRIVLFVGPSHTAEEFIRDDFIVRPVKTLVDLLAFWRGFDSKFHVSAIGPDRLALDMSSELIDSPWMIGSLLGVIDAATWLQDIDDDPFVTAVTVSSSFESVQDIGAVFSDMQRFADECGARLSTGISPDSTDEGERINIWPSDASNYFFDLTFSMLEPLEAQDFARLNQSYKHIDATLAETAYEPETSAEELFEEGAIPYPVEFAIEEQTIRYGMETPASNIAIPTAIFLDILERRIGGLKGWTAEIQPAW